MEELTAHELIKAGLLTEDQLLHSNSGRKKGNSFAVRGGVPFRGRLKAIYKANLHLRTASRILVRLGEFSATTFSELRSNASKLEWERFINPGHPVTFRVTCRKSKLYHSDAVAERIAGAIQDRLGQASPVLKNQEDDSEIFHQLILIRIFRDFCVISIDTSGELLHRRGYRLQTAKAPLRETIAAAIIMLSGWDRRSPLIDPFCGSGTIPIEAAMIALGIPSGTHRSFAFMKWLNFDPYLWNDCLEEASMEETSDYPHITASDRDAGAIRVARANAGRAGAADYIDFSCRSISDIEPSGTGWIVTNPPYGVRVSKSKDLRNLYAQLGNVLKKKCPGWQVGILSNDVRLLNNTGLALDTRLTLDNGGVSVNLGRGTVGNY